MHEVNQGDTEMLANHGSSENESEEVPDGQVILIGSRLVGLWRGGDIELDLFLCPGFAKPPSPAAMVLGRFDRVPAVSS